MRNSGAQPGEIFWDGAGRRAGGPPPLVADQPQGSDEADSNGFDLKSISRALHFKPDQVVCEKDPPKLLLDALDALTANGFLAIEHLGLDLVVPQLQLPTLVIQGHDFRSREFMMEVRRFVARSYTRLRLRFTAGTRLDRLGSCDFHHNSQAGRRA